MATQSRNWVFTLNNPTQGEEDGISAWDTRFSGYGRETGESGTPHLQGMVCFASPQRLSACRKLLDRAHWEVMKGTAVQAWDYCKKDGNTVTYGELPVAGAAGLKVIHDKYDQAIADAKTGSLDAIPGALMTRYHAYYTKLAATYAPVPDAGDVTGLWVVGPTGCGKSRWVRDTYGTTFFHKRVNKWFDGYQPELHAHVLIDDLDTTHAFIAYDLNIWADRYAFPAEVKGGMIKLRPETIIVTSRYTLEQVFESCDESTRASLRRRFKVKNMSPPIILNN